MLLRSGLAASLPVWMYQQAPAENKGLAATAVSAARLDLAALPMQDAAFAAVAMGNHKLALTEGLLKVGAWPVASRMLVWLKGLGAPAAAHAGVRAALCQLLAVRLEPFLAWLQHNSLRGGSHQVQIVPVTNLDHTDSLVATACHLSIVEQFMLASKGHGCPTRFTAHKQI